MSAEIIRDDHSLSRQGLCAADVEKRKGNPDPGPLLQAHGNFQQIQAMMTKCFADIMGAFWILLVPS